MTTINQPLEKMGRVATQMLLDLLHHPEREANRIELPTQLVVRDSCSSPRADSLLDPALTISAKRSTI
jgi:DNA-binding LacI/PurR family transcriptional regulator